MADLLGHLIRSMAAASGPLARPRWQPAVDVYRTADGWLLKYELAGVRPEDIEVHLSGRTVVVRGSRYDWCAAECRHSYSMEIAYNQFERSIQLPCDVESTEVKTEYREGMLLVHVPAGGER
jgi:HSP20 family protein